MKKKHLKNGSPEKEQAKSSKQPKEQGARNRYTDLLGLGIMILLGIIIYSNSFDCSFHFDDSNNIVTNELIRNLSDVKSWWSYNPSRNISVFTFALNYHFNQLDVWYWHLVNLSIHLITACLVYWLTLLIFSSPALKDYPITKHKKSIALFTGWLFVSHPLATQSVTYIVQRMAALAAMFYLLSLSLYTKARLSDRSKASKYLLLFGSFISGLLAIFSKENAFTLPIAIALFEIYFINTKKISLNLRDYRISLLLVTIVGIVSIGFLKYSSNIFKPLPPDVVNDYRIVTSLNYLFTQFSVIVKYICLLILPINQNLDYDFKLANSFFELKTMLNFIILLSLFLLGVFLYKKHRLFSFGIMWFFLTLSIESSFIPISDLIFEHRTYLPSFGFLLVISSGIFLLLWDKYKMLALSIVYLIVGANSFLTFQRNKIWKNDLTLWGDAVSKSPQKARPYNHLGLAYYREGKSDLAIIDYSKAIELQPNYAEVYNNRGIVLDEQNKNKQAINDFSKSIELKPNSVGAYMNRGNVFNEEKNFDLALKDFDRAIELKPNLTSAFIIRGNIYFKSEKYDEALINYSKAIAIEPNNAEAYLKRGNTYNRLLKTQEALSDISKALTLDPNYLTAYLNRGIIFMKQNKNPEALNDFNKAIEINPAYAEAYMNKGNIFSFEKKYEEALTNYSKAIELKPDYAIAYFNRSIMENKLGKKDLACLDMKQSAKLGYQPAFIQIDVFCK
jgi:tetratricopeptide (TPR) repeat protein